MAKAQLEVTTMSSRGQVVLPQEVRDRLKLGEGDKFLVMAEGDTILLKAIKPISKNLFKSMLSATRNAIAKAGIVPKDLESVITKVRNASRS